MQRIIRKGLTLGLASALVLTLSSISPVVAATKKPAAKPAAKKPAAKKPAAKPAVAAVPTVLRMTRMGDW